VVALGASTGGTEAIREVLEGLPGGLAAGLLVVQHMPAGFTLAFADRLDQLCALEVKEARHRDVIRAGRVLVAPGDHHLLVRREGGAPIVELGHRPRVNGHRPSVDVTMEAAAEVFGSRTIGVLLTGMGKDGATGMQRIHQAGGRTIAQDEGSSVVFGMPKAAIDLGVVDEIQSIAAIPFSVRLAVKRLEDEAPVARRARAEETPGG
jgi:two-component system chemotaxis response regulator CheB